MPRRRSRATYLRRRLTVAVAPVLLLAGCLALVRHDDDGGGDTGARAAASAGRPAANGGVPATGSGATTPNGDGEPITVPATAVATAAIPVAPAPTQPTPAPLVVPPGATRFVSVPAQRLFAARLGGAGSHGAPRSSSLRVAGAAGLPPNGISAVVAAVT